MGKKLTTEGFVNKARSVHGSTYDYSKTKYTKAHGKVLITCIEHGDFEMQAYCHTNLKQGCSKCGRIRSTKSQTKTLEKFIAEADFIHEGKYDYSKSLYVNSHKKLVITCNLHKIDFSMRPHSHLNGQGCNLCDKDGKTNTTKVFIEMVREVHGNEYDYSKTEYGKSSELITIGCEYHGYFKMVASGHLRGRGCKKCGGILNGFTKTNFINRCIKNNKGLGSLYVIRCYKEDEVFFKVGITSMDICRRYSGIKSMPYSYDVIKDIHLEAGKVYDIEKFMLKDLAKHSYQPNISFGGETECFSRLESVLSCLDKALNKNLANH